MFAFNRKNPTAVSFCTPPPDYFVLGSKEVHVWFEYLDCLIPFIGPFHRSLSDDEIERMRRFRFQQHRDDYVLGRGMLRMLLSHYVGVPPAELKFRYNDYGKPSLHFDCPCHISFNLAHANRALVCAVTLRQRIGVDVEYMRDDFDYEQVAARIFSPFESEIFRQLPPDMRRRAFFSCWTRKEAYAKARGDGLSLDPRTFDVGFGPGTQRSVLSDSASTLEWSLVELAVPPGYVAAVAVEGQVSQTAGRRTTRCPAVKERMYARSLGPKRLRCQFSCSHQGISADPLSWCCGNAPELQNRGPVCKNSVVRF